MSSDYENLNVPQTMSVRVQIADLVFVANARALPARRVPLTAALKVADRVLARSSYTDLTARAFAVERAVTKFITLATLGARTGESVEHLDLLPIAHPLSTAPSALTASALSEARAEWLAADPRISDELRPLVASAYTLEFGSIERTHALARLEAAGAEVPLDLIALVADGNSSAARSARARRQLRDRLKRFAFEGGMGGFLVRMGEKVKNKVGALVGGSSTTGIGEVYITEDDDELGLKKGDILPVKLDNYEGLDVMLTDEQLKKAGVKLSSSKVSSSKRAQDIQELLANKLEAPSDWKKLPNGDFVTEDGFIATPKGNLQYELKDENGNVVPGLEAAEWPDIQKHIKKAAEDEFGTGDGPAADAEPEKTYVKKDLKVEQLYIGDLLPQYYPIKGAEENLLKKRKEDPNYELPPTDEIIGVYKAKAANKRGIKVRNLETGKERYFEVNKTARIYDVRQKQAESKPETAPTTPALNFGPMMEVDLTPEEILDGKDDKGFESNWIEANKPNQQIDGSNPLVKARNAKKASKKRILEKALGRELTKDEMNALNLNPEDSSYAGRSGKDGTLFLPDQEYLNKKEKTLLDLKAELNLKDLKPKLDISDLNKYDGSGLKKQEDIQEVLKDLRAGLAKLSDEEVLAELEKYNEKVAYDIEKGNALLSPGSSDIEKEAVRRGLIPSFTPESTPAPEAAKPVAKPAPKNPPSKKQKEMIRSMLLERVMTGEQRQAYMDRLGAAESKDINGLFNELKALPKAKVPLTDGSDPLNQHKNPELAKIKQRLAPFDLDGSIRRYIDEKTANGGEVSAKEIRDLLKDNKDFDPTKSYVDYANESQFLNSGLGVYKTESEKKAAEESSAKSKADKEALDAKLDALKQSQADLAPLSKEEHQAVLEALAAKITDDNDPDRVVRDGILDGSLRTGEDIVAALRKQEKKNDNKNLIPTSFASDYKNISADESKDPETWELINRAYALPGAPEGFEPQFIANSLKAYDNENGDLSKLINSGASYQEVLDWLDTNSQAWRTRMEDYDTRGYVDLPWPSQKASWKKFGELLSRMSTTLGEGEGSKEEKPNAEFISALSERLPENAISSLDEELPKAFNGDSLSDLLGKIETEEDLERVVDELTIARASDAVTPEQEALLKKVQDAAIQKFYEDNPDLENTMSEPTDVIPAPIEAETPSLTISELYEAAGDLQDMEGGYPESLFEQVDEIQAGALKIDALNEEVLDLLGDGDREGAAAKLAELADAYDDFAKQVELARELGADAFDDPDFKKKDQDKVIANYKSAAKLARELAAAAKVEEKPSGPELEPAEQTDGDSANQTSTPNWSFDFDLSDLDYLADELGLPEKEDGYTEHEFLDAWLKKNGLDKKGVKYAPVKDGATVTDVQFEIPDSAKNAFAKAYIGPDSKTFWADVADGSYGQPVEAIATEEEASEAKPNWKFDFDLSDPDYLADVFGFPEKEDGYTANEVVEEWLKKNGLDKLGVKYVPVDENATASDVLFEIPDSAKDAFAEAYLPNEKEMFWADVADGNYGSPIEGADTGADTDADTGTTSERDFEWPAEPKSMSMKTDIEKYATDKPNWTFGFSDLGDNTLQGLIKWLDDNELTEKGVRFKSIKDSGNYDDVELYIPDSAKDAFAQAFAGEDGDTFWKDVADGNYGSPIGQPGAPEPVEQQPATAPGDFEWPENPKSMSMKSDINQYGTDTPNWNFGFSDLGDSPVQGLMKWLDDNELWQKGVKFKSIKDAGNYYDVELYIPDSAKNDFAEAYAGQDGESFWKDVADGDHGTPIEGTPEEPEVVPADSETSKDDGNFEWPAEPKSMSMKSDIEKYATENPNWSFDFAELGDKPLQGLIEWLDANKLTEKGVRFKSIADNGNNHSVELYIPDSAKAAFAEAFSGDENFWNDVADGDYGSPIEGVPSPFSTDNSDKLLAEAESNRKEIEDLDFALSTAIDSLGVEYTPMLFGITGNEHIVKNILDDLDASDGANSIALSSSLYELHQALENAGIAPLVTEHVKELADAMDAFTPAEGGDKNDLVTVDTIKQEQDGVLDLSSWKKVGGQKGSNPGGTYENPETGEQVYVKTPKSQLHGENERLASALYDAAGISSAKVLKGKLADGTEVTYSPMIDGAKQDLKKNLKNKEYMARLQEGYALDALLANWDVIGLDFDNVVTDKNGEPVRVDPGGALLFRAQGSPKGGSFGEDVPELDAFTDKTSSRPSAKVFSQMTDEQKLSSAEVLQNLTPSKIDELVNSIITDPEKREELKTKLKARREFILNKFGLGADSEQKKEKNPAPGSSGNTKTLDVTGGIESLQAQLDEAAKNGDLVAFKYNGKDRVVAPKYVWTNPKNGNVNLTGDEGDVSNKNYTLQNFEASSSTSADGDEEEIEEKLAEEKPKSTSSVFGEMKQDLADENFRAAATELIQAKLPAGYTATAEKGILDTGFVLVKNSQGETVAMVTMDPSDPTKFAVQNFKAGWKIETFKMLSQAIDKVVDAVKVVQEPGQVVQLSDGSTGKKGSKVVHSKNGITGTIVGFQKDPNYVKVKPDNGDPIKIMSINQIKSNGSGGEAVSAPEAPNAPEAPSAPEPEAKLNASQIVPQVSENMTLFAGPDGMPVKTIVIKTYEGKWDVIYDYNGPDFKPLHTDIESREEAEDLAIEEIVNPTAAPVGVPTVASQGENYTFYKGPDGKNSQIIANKTFDGKWEVVFDLGGPLEEKLHENLDSREDAEEKAVKAIQADWDSINNPEAATKPAKAAPTGPKKFTFDFMSLSDVTDAPEVKDSGDSLDGDNEKIKADSAGTLIKPGAIVKDENGRVGVYRVLSYGNSDKIRMIWEDGTQDSVFPNTVTATGKYIEPGIAGVYAGLADLDFDKKSEPLPADYIANGLADKNGKNLGYMQLVVDKNGDTGVLVEQKGKDGYVKVAFPDGMKTRKADTLEGLDSRYTKQEYHLKIAQKHYKQLVTYNNDKYNLPTFGTTVKSSKSAGTPGVIAVPKNAAGATAQEVKTLDWNESDFEGVPSLEALLAQVTDTSVADSGLRGGSIALNSGSVEDLDLRIMAASGTSGEDAYLLKYKLTSWAGDDLANKLVEMIKNNDPTVTVSSGLFVPENTIDGDKVSFTPSAYSDKAKYKSPYGETFIVTLEDGTKIYFLRADQPTKHKGGASKVSGDAPRAYHNKVMVIAPRTSTPAQLGFALQTAGVQDVRPSTQADAKILIENRLMSIFDEKVDPKSNLSGKQREESLQRIKDTWGIGPENVTIKPGAGGRVEMRLDEESAKKIANKTKIKVLRHNLTGGSANKNSSYNETLEEKQERIANYFVSRVASPHGGLLSTTTRWSEGVPTGGMSSQADIKTGGADYVFTTPVHGVISKNDSLVPLIYFSAERAFQRLDFWANQSDQFGKRTGKSPIDQAVPGGYEVMFKGRLSFDDAEVLMVSDQTLRTLIITKLRQKGITEIGGRPLEAVIMTGEDYQALQTQATA